MDSEKDIRFTEKKVDESWKEQASRDKARSDASSAQRPAKTSAGAAPASQKHTSKQFLNLVTSLGYQAMMHLGEIPDPSTQRVEVNLGMAKEVIDLLMALQEKTTGHLSPEENEVFESILPELQMKFSARA